MAGVVIFAAGASLAADSDYSDYAGFSGASSELEPKLLMGTRVDADDAQSGGLLVGLLRLLFAPDSNGTADDTSLQDDEDGVSIPESIAQGGPVTLSVRTFNDSGNAAYLNLWIDFDHNGVLNDVLYTLPGGEKLTTQITIPDKSSGTHTISFVVPLQASAGTGRGMRCRLTSVSNPGPGGADGKGEVEDYVIDITTPGFCYGIAEGEIFEINVATGAGRKIANMSMPGTGNALAFSRDLGADGVLIYGTGRYDDNRLAVWDRTTGVSNIAGDLANFGGPANGVLRCGACYAGHYWFIHDGTDDLWKATLTGGSGAYRITSVTKVTDIWGDSSSHSFGDFDITPDGTLLAIGLQYGSFMPEFFSANLNSAAPVATRRGLPVIGQNGVALGLDGKLYAGLGLYGNNQDWYTIDPADGNILNTIGASNLAQVADMTLAAPFGAPAVDALSDYGDFSRFPAAGSLSLNNLRLGGVIDGETATVPNATATTDDITGSDDEDGVVVPPAIARGARVSLPITLFNNTGASAYLSAWVDFNNDGALDDALGIFAGGERLMSEITIPPSATPVTQNVTFSVPSAASAGPARGLRVRLCSIGGQGPAGMAGYGEVEDYVVDIATSPDLLGPWCGSPLFSMAAFVTGSGKTFTMTGTTTGVIGQVGLASGVAANFSTGGITGPFLIHPPQTGNFGEADDFPGGGGAPLVVTLQNLSAYHSEAIGLANAAASLPATQRLGTLTSAFTINATAPDGRNVVYIDEVSLTNRAAMTINGGALDTFVINVARKMDFAGSSTMAISGGISPSRIMVNMLPGSTDLNLTGTSGSYSAFFVAVQPTNIVTAAGNSIVYGGILAHQLTLSGGVQIIASPYQVCPLTDYSDHSGLPLTSSSTDPRLRLGANLDAEEAALPNVTATGDDTTGVDDEDGAPVPAEIVAGDIVSIPVTLLNNTGEDACLNAWIDFDGSGTLDDALASAGGEKLMTQLTIPSAVAPSTRTITFRVPPNAGAGTGRGVRLRLTRESDPGPTRLSGIGEVEDYVTRIDRVGLAATMEVRPAGAPGWSANVAVEAGSRVEYQLTLTNSGTVALRDPAAIDLLPAPGDTGAAVMTPRGSAWRALLTGAVSPPAGVDVFYSLVQNPQRPEVFTPDPAGSLPPAWASLPANPTTVSSLKIDGASVTLAGGASLAITWTMAVPWDAVPYSTAWNSAGATAVRADTGTPLAPVESSRSGVQALTPGGSFYGDTVWIDANANGLQNADETGVNGIRVDFYQDNGDGLADPGTDALIASTFTTSINGQAGRYRFGQFPPGDYFATVNPSDLWSFTVADRGITDANDSDAHGVIRSMRRMGIMPVTRLDEDESDLTWDAGLIDRAGTPAVWAVAEMADGRMVLGGRFAKSHGAARRNIARVYPNGTADASFNPGTGFDDTVRSIALRSDGMIWAGGSFSSYNGAATRGIALLNANGAWDSRPDQPDTSEVYWVGASGDFMYLAGQFTKVGGIPCGNVARLKPDGKFDSGFNQGSGADGPIYAGSVLPNGGIILGGAFTKFHGDRSIGVVKLKADGKVDRSFDPGAGPAGEVYSVKLIEDGRITLTGNFTSFDGAACNGVIRLTAQGKVDGTLQKSSLNVNAISTSN